MDDAEETNEMLAVIVERNDRFWLSTLSPVYSSSGRAAGNHRDAQLMPLIHRSVSRCVCTGLD